MHSVRERLSSGGKASCRTVRAGRREVQALVAATHVLRQHHIAEQSAGADAQQPPLILRSGSCVRLTAGVRCCSVEVVYKEYLQEQRRALWARTCRFHCALACIMISATRQPGDAL